MLSDRVTSCVECVYFDLRGVREELRYGRCRLNPPARGSTYPHEGFPQVFEGDGCAQGSHPYPNNPSTPESKPHRS